MEIINVYNELSNIFNQFLKEPTLFILKLLLLVFLELDEFSPVHLKHVPFILFFFVLDSVWMVDVENLILLKHGAELHLDYGLFLLNNV